MRSVILAAILLALAASAALAGFAIFQINGAGVLPTGPGLTIGTYGSTTASGWTHIGPSNGTLASAAFTNIIYVSDSLGDDNRDGSTPTFVDDNTTEQFVLSSTSTASAGAIYSDGTRSFTVASAISAAKFVQMTSRTGIPGASGTLTRTGGAAGDATMTFIASTPGIHGPVKTLIKGAGGSGPGAYDPDNTGTNNGDGTGLGTIGNWHTAGAGNGFALRSGKPDWLLLRMGDTFTGQAFEVAFSGSSDNFGKGGFSEQEPMVISSYDEAVPATSPDLPSGARARPIIQVPSATNAYAAMQGAGNFHLFSGRTGIQLQGAGNYIVVMGLDFYSAQRDPGNGAYVGNANLADGTAGISITAGKIGVLIEDVHIRWMNNGIGGQDIFDINIRRNQVDHCYGPVIKQGLGIFTTGAIGGAISPGLSIEENVLDLCGYDDAAFTMGNSRDRNAYIQNDAVFGNRRGNTSTRSGSENFQFRSGGIIDNNFVYSGSFGFDVGHPEADPTLTSSTVVTNNVIMTPDSPLGVNTNIGLNFGNWNNGTATNNIIAHSDPAAYAFLQYAATDAYDGTSNLVHASNVGSGGTQGQYGCVGGSGNFTGGHSTQISTYSLDIGSGGSITAMHFIEPFAGGTSLVGDVLTPVAGYPSINTAGTTLSNVGTGGTPGNYGFTFAQACALHPANQGFGVAAGMALTGGSGTGALATFAYSPFSSITRTLNVGTGFYEATGTLSTSLIIFAGDKFTVTGVTPSAYNGTWIALNGTPDGSTAVSTITWSLNTSLDPGAETVPGQLTDYVIISTGKNYAPSDVLTASPGGRSGLQITVNTVASLTGWQLTIDSITSNGVHGLSFTGNTIFNFPGALNDLGGTHDSPGGVPGSGAANVWTPNTSCATSQFPGSISGGTTLTSGTVAQGGAIAIGQNLAGVGVAANTTITGGSAPTWTISPSQSNISTETMYSYTCTPTKVYAHPERSVSTYAASLGLTATIDGYMTAALANAKWNWNPALTANNGINPYIRLGFQ